MTSVRWSNIAASEEVERLRGELAAERKLREAAERCVAETCNERADLAEKLRQTERERDRLAEHVEATINGPFGPEVVLLREGLNLSEWAERAQRAEADNAARLEAIQRARNLLLYPSVPWDEVVPEVLRVLDPTVDDHPGAAMLERMRALEEVATKASAELRHTYRPETRDWNLVARAIAMLEQATTPKPETK